MPPQTSFFRYGYRYVAKPLFFHLDPEMVHDHMHSFGHFLGNYTVTRRLTRWAFAYQNPLLEQTIAGVTFPNPIGLSAGFDKDAYLVNILPEVGFGFIEIGSVTADPCSGNARPRLWRLQKSRSLVVNYGLKSIGCEAVAERLATYHPTIPLGINIAKTPVTATSNPKKGVEDYLISYRKLAPLASYLTINVSCPNVGGGLPFCEPDNLELLLTALEKEKVAKPHFLKLAPDLPLEQIKKLVTLGQRFQVTGYICSNLTKPRDNTAILDKTVPPSGGMSGKVLDPLADQLISEVYRLTKGKTVIIASGGVFSAADAYRKIKLGASLVQLITGMIFEGPQLIGEINRGLVTFLHKDGYTTLTEAIGVDAKL